MLPFAMAPSSSSQAQGVSALAGPLERYAALGRPCKYLPRQRSVYENTIVNRPDNRDERALRSTDERENNDDNVCLEVDRQSSKSYPPRTCKAEDNTDDPLRSGMAKISCDSRNENAAASGLFLLSARNWRISSGHATIKQYGVMKCVVAGPNGKEFMDQSIRQAQGMRAVLPL